MSTQRSSQPVCDVFFRKLGAPLYSANQRWAELCNRVAIVGRTIGGEVARGSMVRVYS